VSDLRFLYILSVSLASNSETNLLCILLSKILQQMLHVYFVLISSVDWAATTTMTHAIPNVLGVTF
jgi:hypothetical protein